MDLLLHDKKILRPVDTPLYTGWEPDPTIKVIEGKPKFQWKGAKIPFALWAEMVSFLRWTQKKYKEEAMLTLFYHQAERKWAAWPFPQEPNGMTIRLLHSHPLYAEDRKKFSNGWVQAGSIHHHCAANAFQSSTDKNDEEDRDGVHITLGKMDEHRLNIHIRQVFDGVQGDTSVLDWIDHPEYVANAPKYLKFSFTLEAIQCVQGEPYPPEWESRIFERTRHYNQHQLPGFPTGAHHPQTGPQMNGHASTILTGGTNQTSGSNAGPGTASTEPKKSARNNDANGAPRTGGAGGTTGATVNWEQNALTRLTDICARLGIDEITAYGYLAAPTNPAYNAEDHELRKSLIGEIHKSGLPILYAESILERMLQGIGG